MRKILTSDLFKAARILKNAGISETLKNIYDNANGNDKQVGIDAVFSLMGACATTESEKGMYDLLGGIIEEDVESMPIADLYEKLKQVSEENDLKSFFSQLSGLMK